MFLLPGQRSDPEKNKDHIYLLFNESKFLVNIYQMAYNNLLYVTYNKYIKDNALNTHYNMLT